MDLSALASALDTIVLARQEDGRFRVESGVPTWCHALRPQLSWNAPIDLEDVFPFLGVFLPEAERRWESGEAGRAESEIWSETDPAGGPDVHLVASAVRAGEDRMLIIIRSELRYIQRQSILQRARELRMVHASLMREIEVKDVLTHAVVHDLVAPLHSITGILSLLAERATHEPEAGWLKLAVQAANRQRDLIREILDVSMAEGGALFGDVSADGVDVWNVLERVVAERLPVARSRNLRIDYGPQVENGYVIAEETRLFRVLTNLLDNAIRYSPLGGVVRVTLRENDATIFVCVEDDGPGVQPAILPHLFEKFSRARDGTGETGLGLFFCRITVENWGGGIGYEPREGGGARFWIRLRRAIPKVRERKNDNGEAPDARR
jgi:signal transduction histidine kinase